MSHSLDIHVWNSWSFEWRNLIFHFYYEQFVQCRSVFRSNESDCIAGSGQNLELQMKKKKLKKVVETMLRLLICFSFSGIYLDWKGEYFLFSSTFLSIHLYTSCSNNNKTNFYIQTERQFDLECSSFFSPSGETISPANIKNNLSSSTNWNQNFLSNFSFIVFLTSLSLLICSIFSGNFSPPSLSTNTGCNKS